MSKQRTGFRYSIFNGNRSAFSITEWQLSTHAMACSSHMRLDGWFHFGVADLGVVESWTALSGVLTCHRQCLARATVTTDHLTVMALSPFVSRAGIIAYQLLTGRLPFDDDEAREMGAAFLASHAVDRKEAFRATLSAPLDFDKAPWDAISPAARDFCMALLQRDPAARPAAADMLRHPWLASQHADERPADGGINDTLVQRLQRYGTYGKLKQAALRAVAECIRSDSNFVADLRQGFETLDPGRTGSIPYSALVDMLENGVRDESGVHRLYDLSPLEVRQLVSTFHVGAHLSA